jgi:hypothetical protein
MDRIFFAMTIKITKLPNDGKIDDVNVIKLPNGGESREYSSGNKYWYLNGRRHREDGPAIEWFSGDKHWYINGEFIHCETQKQFEQFMRLRAFW